MIIAPYVWLLIAGDEYLSSIIDSFIIGFLVTGLLLAVIRLFFRDNFIKALWQVYARVYDGLLYFYPYQYLISRVAQIANESFPKSVLDLGGGSGNVARLLHAEKITVVDSSSQMLKKARKKLHDFQGLTIINQDITSFLASATDKFDVIVMNNSLYVVEDREKLWEGLHNTLNEGGVVVVSNSDKAGSSSIIKEHISKKGFLSLLRPKLIAIFMVDQLISSLSETGAFSFIPYSTITHETKGLFKPTFVERCYGGEENGVNIIFTLRKT